MTALVATAVAPVMGSDPPSPPTLVATGGDPFPQPRCVDCNVKLYVDISGGFEFHAHYSWDDEERERPRCREHFVDLAREHYPEDFPIDVGRWQYVNRAPLTIPNPDKAARARGITDILHPDFEQGLLEELARWRSKPEANPPPEPLLCEHPGWVWKACSVCGQWRLIPDSVKETEALKCIRTPRCTGVYWAVSKAWAEAAKRGKADDSGVVDLF